MFSRTVAMELAERLAEAWGLTEWAVGGALARGCEKVPGVLLICQSTPDDWGEMDPVYNRMAQLEEIDGQAVQFLNFFEHFTLAQFKVGEIFVTVHRVQAANFGLAMLEGIGPNPFVDRLLGEWRRSHHLPDDQPARFEFEGGYRALCDADGKAVAAYTEAELFEKAGLPCVVAPELRAEFVEEKAA